MISPRRSPSRPGGSARPWMAALALVGALAGCGFAEPPGLELGDRGAPGAADRQVPASKEPDAIRVATYVVTPRRLDEEVILTGEIRAAESVALRAETSGRVVALRFQEGQAVRAGTLLVKINDAELAAEKKRAAIRLELAAQRESRLGRLLAEGTISQDLYDEAANAQAVLEAEIELYDARIAETEVRAPFDGVVGLRAISVGSYLTPQTVITTVQVLDPIKIDVTAAERYAGRIHRGDRIAFTVAGSERVHEGRIFAIDQRIDAETRTIRVRARAPNPGGTLLPGAFARVRLILGGNDAALMVPSIALVPGLVATIVFVVEDGHAAAREVETGRRTATEVEIVGGLDAGERVIISGIQAVRPGSAVAFGADQDAAMAGTRAAGSSTEAVAGAAP